ncbi:hypothetical protein [Novosphingobium sp. ST904]|uniref:DUF7673 family protein n=1 Tax=Novosphingobium sp. ST904 TaxID=1684385 RepID=UPI0006C880AA|nr:hypothetical protein [Novosphingobium sp. ST904]KPH63570.1 hypothetical protein ADT71_13115 [Novosphingobium sp. ST904]TCM32358.1 hypothetical protein EDF59_12453 [Novosphingobium sp. ST904]
MTAISIDVASAKVALDRLIDVARSDTGQSKRVANFLLAWWNGDDWGHFPIADLFGLDREVGLDIARIVGFLAAYPEAIYADQFGRREELIALVHQWREVVSETT